MSDKSAVGHPSPVRKSQPFYERDTLQAIDQLFLHDQLEALLASPTLARVAARHSESGDDLVDSDDSVFERDTEPSVDAELLRAALAAGLK